MAYVKVNWAAGVTPLSEANMDHLETQYDEGKTDLDAHRINIGAGDGRHRWTANKLLQGAGAAAPTEIDVPDSATMELFVPWDQYANATPGGTGDFGGIRIDAAAESIKFNFKIPHDFTALTSLKVIGIKNTNGTIDWTATTDFAAIGEAYNTNSDSDTENALAMTDTEIEEVDISDALTAPAADDYVGLKFLCDAISAGSYDVIGLVVKYS